MQYCLPSVSFNSLMKYITSCNRFTRYFSLFNVHLRPFTTQQAVTVADVLQTIGLPRLWGCYANNNVYYSLLGCDAIQTGTNQPNFSEKLTAFTKINTGNLGNYPKGACKFDTFSSFSSAYMVSCIFDYSPRSTDLGLPHQPLAYCMTCKVHMSGYLISLQLVV